MRVGYDITALDNRPSGVGNYTRCLLGQLLEYGAEHEFLLLSNRPGQVALEPATNGYSVQARFPSRMLWMQCMLPLTLRKLRPHLCHYTNSIGPLDHPGPYVVTIHDMTLSLLPSYHPWRKQLLVRPIVALTARRAQRIITVSEHAKKDIIRLLRVPAERVIVTPEAAESVFVPVDQAEQQRIRTLYGLHKPYLLYVGTLEPRKNLVRLIAAWQQLRRKGIIPHQLVIVGARGWQDAPIYRQVQALGCADDVIFTGYVPQADLPGLYSAAELFAFPSLSEGFGLPVIEAMACGTPALISSAPALVEVAGDAALQIDPHSVASIAQGMEHILTDEKLRAQLRERGLRRAAMFSWQQTAKQTLEVYRSVVERNFSWSATA